MGRSHARILTTIWRDPDFVATSADAQRTYLLLLSQPTVSFCGVIAYTPTRWAALSPGTTAKAIVRTVDELERRRFLVVDRTTEEIWIRSFVKNDGVLKGGPKLISAMWKDYEAINSPALRSLFVQSLPPDMKDGVSHGVSEGVSDTPSGPPPDEPPEPPSDASRARTAPIPVPIPVPAPSSSSIPPTVVDVLGSEHQSAEPAVVEEEEELPKLEATARTIAQRRLTSRQADPTLEPIKSPARWLVATTADVESEYGPLIRRLVREGLSPDAIADQLEPSAESYPYQSFDEERESPWTDETIQPDGSLLVTRR